MTEEEQRYRYLQLKAKAAQEQPAQAQLDETIVNENPMPEQGIQRFLPEVGGAVGGTMGSLLPTPARAAVAGLGTGAGEALNQIISRMRGQETPQTSEEAAKRIAKKAGASAVAEAVTPSVFKLVGKAGKAAAKGFAGFGEAVSGTPAKNILRAINRGFKETYLPKGQIFKSRAKAGAEQGVIEKNLFKNVFTPEERVSLLTNKGGFADEAINNAFLKKELGQPLTPKEALATVQSIDAKFPTPTAKKMGLSAEMTKLRQEARAAIAEAYPEYSNALKTTEKAITRSQLSKPFKVNRSNPDKYSGFSGAIAPLLGAGTYAAGGGVLPTVFAALGSSPLAFGVTGSLAGSAANMATSKLGKRAIAQLIAQSVANKEGQ